MDPSTPTPKSQTLAGARATLAYAPGIVAWGVIAGVATVAAGVAPLTAFLMCLIVYAGAAQLAALQMLSIGPPLPIIVLAALIINSRFALFSLSMAAQLPANLPLRKRLLFAYLLSDNSYGAAVARFSYHPDEPHKDKFLLGAGLVVWAAWQVGTIAGVGAGSAIPPSWSLEFAVPLAFLALGVAVIRDLPMLIAALAAGTVAVLAWHLPYRMGLITAAFTGILAGIAAEQMLRGRRPPQ